MIDSISIKWNKVTLSTFIKSKAESIDLLQSFREITINENIENKFLSGKIEFDDLNAVFNSNQFYTGSSYLDINFDDLLSNNVVKYRFLITGMSDIVKTQNSQVVTLTFIDEKAILFASEYTGYINNELISDWVSRFSSDKLSKPLTLVEKTNTKISLTLPYQKPNFIFKFLNWYSKSSNNYYNYVYFTNSKNETNYCTYSYLMSKPAVMKFQEVYGREVELSINNFNEYSLQERWNPINTSLNYGFGGTKFTFNASNKSVVKQEYKYSTLVNTSKVLGKYSMYPNDYDNTKDKIYYSSSLDSYKFEINNNMEQINTSIKVSFGVDGAYGRVIGGIADIVFKEMYDFTKTSNEERSGKYLVTAIIHHFFKGAYKQEIQAIRTGININNKNLISV